jgi:N-acetylglucosamine-6-sulfatase
MFSKILSSRTWLVAAVAFATAFPVVATAEGEVAIPQGSRASLPNIVLILTDDQRADTLRYMPNVNRLLVHQGITFNHGYVVNPVCCPSRASILTGNYSHTTKVYTNHPGRPFGGFPAFDDDSTIGTWLHDGGYRTGLFGKYLNGYGNGYVPPGWDHWFATYGGGAYFDYTAVSDGDEEHYGSDPADYGTAVLQREAVTFIRDTDTTQPLFMMWATHGPHKPATPQGRDKKAFSSLPPWRPRSYDEADVSDKPAHIRAQPMIDRATSRSIDRFRIHQLRALQSVDRAVAKVVDALRDTDRLENTLIVFTSDNGMMWGEHRLDGKGEIYEESISVPFVVRYDALIDRARTDDDHLVLNIDLAPTFAALASVDAPVTEGRSLLGLLGSASISTRWRDAFLIEHLGHEGGRNAPTFCAVHTERYVLARYSTGEEELYDLVRDPRQMTNVDRSSSYNEHRGTLRSTLRALCDPLPPGYSF